MPRPPHIDGINKALRRQSQIEKLRRDPKWNSRLPQAGASRHTLLGPGSALSDSAKPSHLTSSSSSPALLQANRALRDAYLQSSASSLLSSAERDVCQALRLSESKEAAQKAFMLLVQSSDTVIHPHSFAQFATTLLQHQVRGQMGHTLYAAALQDVVDSPNQQWSDVTAEEQSLFLRYHSSRLGRYAVKGTHFNAALGLSLEGSDNRLVALAELHLRKNAERALPVTCDVLSDFMQLDVSWSAALQLYGYAKEAHHLDPPVDMTTRVLALMTGYRSNGLGSRPWRKALELYEDLLRSGYEATVSTHTAALDAVWRSGDTFVRPHHRISQSDREEMWNTVQAIQHRVVSSDPPLHIGGEEGCAYMESLIKASAAAGRWEAAVQVLRSMDTTLDDTSSRLLLPTPEAFLFAMAACNAAQNAAYAESLRLTFGTSYSLRSAHPEALWCYLSSLRYVEGLNSSIGEQVENLLLDGKGLDRPCTVACLQLLSSQLVKPPTCDKTQLALQLYHYYDSNVWVQQPLARKAELQIVFRSLHVIAATAAGAGGSTASPSSLMASVREHIQSVFGAESEEMRWLQDTEIYALLSTPSWNTAMQLYDRHVRQRPPDRVADLPVPLRQIRYLFVQTLLRCCRAAAENNEADQFLLEDDTQDSSKMEAYDLAKLSVQAVRDAYADTDEVRPSTFVGEMLLLQAIHSSRLPERQQLALQGMRELSCGSVAAITQPIRQLVSEALSLTEEHVESVLVEGHTSLRYKSLAMMQSKKHNLKLSSLEKFYA